MIKRLTTSVFTLFALSAVAQSAASVTLGNSTLQLPSGWKEQSKEAERITLRSPDGRSQATFSILQFDATASFDDFKRLCELRLKAEKEPSGDIFVQSDGPFDQAGSFGMFFSGGEKSANRIFSGYLSLKSRELITIYVEGIGEDPKKHLELFKSFVTGLKTR